MSLRLYIDHNVHAEIVHGLRRRDVDCLTAAEDGRSKIDDDALLDRATALGRVMLSQDIDLLAIAIARMRAGTFFAGVIYAPQMGVTIGDAIRDAELMAKGMQPEEMRNWIERLPLR